METASRVTVQAATLAGGNSNQDRYAYGDGWAYVLDGASSFAPTNTGQNGGWYAERLSQALSRLLPGSTQDTANIVAQAIVEAASAYAGDPAICPTSTIALARWDDHKLETYVLGDSTAVVITTDGAEHITTDNRIAAIRPDLREHYKKRLREGNGFDEEHQAILVRLQAAQLKARNKPQGYWIAGSERKAAHHPIRAHWDRQLVSIVSLMTDGIANSLDVHKLAQFQDQGDLDEAMKLLHATEERDSEAKRVPRSKIHDDKTLILISGWSSNPPEISKLKG